MAYPPAVGEPVTLRGLVSTVFLKRDELMGVEWQTGFQFWVEEGWAEIVPGLIPNVADMFVTVRDVREVMGETLTPAFIDAVAQAGPTLAAAQAAAAAAQQAAADTAGHVVGVPAGGWPKSNLTTSVQASLDRADSSVLTSDGRLSDARAPIEGSVTDASVASGAGIDPAKLGAGRVVGTVNGVRTSFELSKVTLAQFNAITTKDSNTWYGIV